MGVLPHESIDAEFIACELKAALSPSALAEFKLPSHWIGSAKNAKHGKKGQESIFKIANEVAFQYRQSVSYSNFHTWEHFQQFKSGKEASEAPPPSSSQSFQNYLYMANSCASAFRSALLAMDQNYAYLADRIHIATDSWHQRPTSSREYHCLVMLRLPNFCVVIDPVAYPFTLKVPVNGLWEAKFCTYRFRYVAIGDVRLLVHVQMSEEDTHHVLPHPLTQSFFIYNDPFRDVRGGFKGGVEYLAYPTDSYQGRLPSNRALLIDQLWDAAPTNPSVPHYPLQDGSGRCLVETCKIGMSFETRYMWITAIPLEWVHRPANAYFLRRLKDRNTYFILEGGVHAELQLELQAPTDIRKGFTKRTKDNLKFVQELAEALGLEKDELVRIAEVMLGWW
jgi:hypothetical protein